ncbi:MAG: thiamine pyrophosphate-dependent enzyme, partial [Pseudomonadota bacterium]|nr:thiamine pyrophosphate-dependent enzyme [Pseudomonadota bacterium]
MGAAAAMGLGLALAEPERKVMVVTGDGESLMNVVTLATVGVLNPPNISIIYDENEHYGE